MSSTLDAVLDLLAVDSAGVVRFEGRTHGRIMGQAYDAMTVARPYSAPLTSAEAIAECRRPAGAQFDPAAVAALEIVPA